jgi:hypothetical protein
MKECLLVFNLKVIEESMMEENPFVLIGLGIFILDESFVFA